MLKDRTYVFPNGINIEKFGNGNGNGNGNENRNENRNVNMIVKKKYSFIYSSFPNRGLIHLLKMFPKIREKIPDAKLNVFCDTQNNWVQSVSKEEMNQVDLLLEEQKEYVTNNGWVTKEVLRNH